jgi:TMEM199 family protein
MDSQDYILWVKPSQQMLEFIKSEVESSGDLNIPKQITDVAAGNVEKISADDLEWVYERTKKQEISISEMGLELELPVPDVAPRNPVLEKRCERLRREQDNREYRAMTKMVDSARYKEPEESIAYQMKQINRHLIGVVQFVFSVAAGFAFGFQGLELLIGDLEMGFRLMCGISIALVIAVAEIYFLLQHIHLAEEVPPERPAAQLPVNAANTTKAHQE